MSTKSNRKKTMSGGAKLKAAGKRAVLLGIFPKEFQSLKDAAERERRPLTQFILYYALKAAAGVPCDVSHHRA